MWFWSAMAGVFCFGLCHMDAMAGPWTPLVWLKVSLCYSISSVQERAFEVGPLWFTLLGDLGEHELDSLQMK